MRTRSVRLALAAATLGVVTLASASAVAEPMHDPPPAELGSCPTGWELWWVPDHLGWFEYTINHYADKDHNGNGVLCRKVVKGVGVQDEHHDQVWVTKDDAAYRP
ncbi:hypothetical protein GA707_19115 [Nostocoides sp. F2B08]|uniref:hypothetical protein n=1 Tax=Nostocoides sp. F2B08 TaxID=2653936 RepID=UPI0012631C6C|nr:hypothetical protein [Tetrasphaera sp. F2B08]KAB7740613.1 hypothetical protein GA707_19115 [Tetrasphaera sp. F2B08]